MMDIQGEVEPTIKQKLNPKSVRRAVRNVHNTLTPCLIRVTRSVTLGNESHAVLVHPVLKYRLTTPIPTVKQ